MTNKNKQKRTKEAKDAQDQKRQALKEQVEAVKSYESAAPEVKPGSFSKGQLNAIMLVGVGITKLMSIAQSIRMKDEPAKLCTQYFREDSLCTDDGLNVLLRFKYFLSLQVLMTVMTVVLQCWQSDEVLIRYTGALLASPVFATVFTLVLNDSIFQQRTVWYRDVIVGMILTYVVMPAKTHIPFVTGNKQRNNTFQSFALMTFCAFALFDMADCVATLFQSSVGLSEALFTPSFSATLEGVESTAPALKAVTEFYLIDKFTIAGSLFFAWFYLKESHHRVSIVC